MCVTLAMELDWTRNTVADTCTLPWVLPPGLSVLAVALVLLSYCL